MTGCVPRYDDYIWFKTEVDWTSGSSQSGWWKLLCSSCLLERCHRASAVHNPTSRPHHTHLPFPPLPPRRPRFVPYAAKTLLRQVGVRPFQAKMLGTWRVLVLEMLGLLSLPKTRDRREKHRHCGTVPSYDGRAQASCSFKAFLRISFTITNQEPPNTITRANKSCILQISFASEQ